MKEKYFNGISSREELKIHWIKLCKIHHPDKGGDISTMQDINSEYEAILKSGRFGVSSDIQADLSDLYTEFKVKVAEYEANINEYEANMVFAKANMDFAKGKFERYQAQPLDLPDPPDIKLPDFDAPCFDIPDINFPDPLEIYGTITKKDFKSPPNRKTGIWQVIKNRFKL